MNLSRYLIALGTSTLMISACGATEKIVYVPQERANNTVVITDPDRYEQPDEDAFINGVGLLHDNAVYLPDSELLETGYLVCEGLRGGLTADDAITAMNDSSDGDSDVYSLLAALTASAVTYLCPDQGYKFSGEA